MQYRIDPKSGNKLSILGFGCMRFPRGLSIDKEKTEKILLLAIDNGVNYFDTAYIYPGSEALLGAILDKHKLRDKIYIATKLPHQQATEESDFDRIFNEQLERLRTDHIDYYLIHNLSDKATWGRLSSLGIEKWLAKKKELGQIRQVGFSFHGALGAFMELVDSYDWDMCQIQYNYSNDSYQAGVKGLKRANEKGMAVMIMEPLLGGRLASSLPKKAVASFKEAEANRSLAEWGFRWIWDQAEPTVVLSGMNSEAQVLENILSADAAMAGMVSKKEAAAYESAIKAFRESYKVPCTGCNYCMPCPNGVNIPGCFAAYNSSYSSGFVTGLTQYLTSTGANHPGKGQRVVNCKKCGLCEKKCPQHIKIQASLQDVKKRMEPFWFGLALAIVNAATNTGKKKRKKAN